MTDCIKPNGLKIVVAFLLGGLLVYCAGNSIGFPGSNIDSAHAVRRKSQATDSSFARSRVVDSEMAVSSASFGVPNLARTIAYSYFWSVEIKDRNAMKGRIDALTEKCTAAGENCELLNANITSDRVQPGASLSLRLAPELVDDFKKMALQDGQVLTDNKSSDQMADQIMDVERRLAVQESYLQRLDELAKNPGTLEEALNVQQQITQTISEVEALRSRAQAQQKSVRKEAVNINYQVPPPATASTEPVTSAFEQFGVNMGQSTAAMIDLIAKLLPWAVLLLILFYLSKVKTIMALRQRKKTDNSKQ